MKKFLLVAGACFGILFLVIGGGLWFILRGGTKNAEDVAKLCTMPLGTSIEHVIPQARSLGFRTEEQGALGQGIELFTGTGTDRTIWKEDALPGVSEGRLMFGKVILPPFSRHYCEVKFSDRKVVSTRVVELD